MAITRTARISARAAVTRIPTIAASTAITAFSKRRATAPSSPRACWICITTACRSIRRSSCRWARVRPAPVTRTSAACLTLLRPRSGRPDGSDHLHRAVGAKYLYRARRLQQLDLRLHHDLDRRTGQHHHHQPHGYVLLAIQLRGVLCLLPGRQYPARRDHAEDRVFELSRELEHGDQPTG